MNLLFPNSAHIDHWLDQWEACLARIDPVWEIDFHLRTQQSGGNPAQRRSLLSRAIHWREPGRHPLAVLPLLIERHKHWRGELWTSQQRARYWGLRCWLDRPWPQSLLTQVREYTSNLADMLINAFDVQGFLDNSTGRFWLIDAGQWWPLNAPEESLQNGRVTGSPFGQVPFAEVVEAARRLGGAAERRL
jgi:hypothetical protein